MVLLKGLCVVLGRFRSGLYSQGGWIIFKGRLSPPLIAVSSGSSCLLAPAPHSWAAEHHPVTLHGKVTGPGAAPGVLCPRFLVQEDLCKVASPLACGLEAFPKPPRPLPDPRWCFDMGRHHLWVGHGVVRTQRALGTRFRLVEELGSSRASHVRGDPNSAHSREHPCAASPPGRAVRSVAPSPSTSPSWAVALLPGDAAVPKAALGRRGSGCPWGHWRDHLTHAAFFQG